MYTRKRAKHKIHLDHKLLYSESMSACQPALKTYFSETDNTFDIGVDEAGRGPLFGRVYASAVILPKPREGDSDDEFHYSWMKDSKKFTSKKKIQEVADYIKSNAVAWSVCYEDEKTIDNINILQATQQAMHRSIKECMIMCKEKLNNCQDSYHLLIDGNYFNSYIRFDKTTGELTTIPHTCVKGGDNQYACIAAASILAKVSRDKYIEELCDTYPLLDEYYHIRGNKGYGAKHHMQGIREHGITKWHRRSYAPCKEANIIDIS